MNEQIDLKKLRALKSQYLDELIKLKNLESEFTDKESWDLARNLDIDLFIEKYGIDFKGYRSQDFDIIIEKITRQEKLLVSVNDDISKLNVSISEESLALSTKSLSLDDKSIQITQSNQKSASVFSQSKEYPKGFGYLPIVAHFDPTYQKEIHSLTSRLVPIAEDIEKAPLLKIYGQNISFTTNGETENGGISQQFLKYADKNYYNGLKANGQKQFGTKGLTSGIASGESYEDFHIEIDGIIGAMFEVEGAEGSLLGAVSQAAVSATNVAMSLLTLGVSKDDCVVPAIGSNGLSIIFGAIILLDISFPTYIPISKLLDLSCPHERQMASALFMKAATHCNQICKTIKQVRRNTTKTKVPMQLNMKAYFVKKYTPDVFASGLGLFDVNFSVGLHHMVEVFNKLYSSETARHIVEFPLSVRTADEASEYCNEIIYRDLRQLGYKCGAPNRIDDSPLLFEAYKLALFAAVDSIHKAGVIHCDLYISNVMWKLSLPIQNNSSTAPEKSMSKYTVDIKIIDWDVSHCINEKVFAPKVGEILQDYFREHPTFKEPKFGVELDLCYLSVFDKKVSEENKKYWCMISSDSKSEIDSGFKSLLFE